VGWADEQCTPLFICYVNNRGQAGTKPEKEKEEGLTCGGCCCWRSCWSRLVASLVVRGSRQCYSFFLFLLCFSFFSLLLLFFFRSSPSLLFSLCFFFSVPSSLSLLSRFFFFSSPVFIGKNKGETWLGWPLCYLPSTIPPTCGKFLFGKWGWSASF